VLPYQSCPRPVRTLDPFNVAAIGRNMRRMFPVAVSWVESFFFFQNQ
jgi:hypothetical protein